MQELVGEITGSSPDPSNLAALKAVFVVWDAARGGNALPRRQDLLPEHLHAWMPNLAMLRFDEVLDDWVYSLQGNRLVDHTSGNLTNQRLSEIIAQPGQAEMGAQLLRCAEIRQPCWFFNIPSTFRDYARIDKLELPFGSDAAVTHILVAMYRNPPIQR